MWSPYGSFPYLNLNGRFRRVSPIASRPDEGPLTEPTAAAQPSSPEPLFMPLSRSPHRRISITSADETALTR